MSLLMIVSIAGGAILITMRYSAELYSAGKLCAEKNVCIFSRYVYMLFR